MRQRDRRSGARGVVARHACEPARARARLERDRSGTGIAALVDGPWPHLGRDLRCNRLGPDDVARLLSGALPALRRLGIDENPLGAGGLAAVVAAPVFERLEWLNLGGTGIDDAALEEHWPFARRFAALRELRVHDNDVSEAMLDRLRGSLPDCDVLI